MASPWLGVPFLLLGSLAPGFLLCLVLSTRQGLSWEPDWTRNLDLGECLFVQVLAGVLLNSWLLLVLAELGLFKLPVILTSWALICAGLIWRGRRRLAAWTLPRPRLSCGLVGLLLVLVLAGVLFARPAQSLLVLDDSGIYFLGGVQLAKTGSLFTRDAVLASLSPETGSQLLFTGPRGSSWSRLWGQFFVWEWGKPLVTFGLLHLQRVWCALFTLFLGLYGGLWVAPAFGLLASAGLYFLGRRLFSPTTGLLAAALLSCNFIQIWHARLPLSEMLGQALLVGGFYLLALFIARRSVWLGVLAGVCLGSLFLVRIDGILVGALLLGMLLYVRWSGRWRSEYAPFALALVGALAYAAMHAALFGWAYLVSLWQTAGSPALARLAVLGVLCVGAALLAAWRRPALARSVTNWLWAHTWQVLAAAVGAVAVLLALSRALSGPAKGRAVLWLAQYWSLLGIFLALLGLVLLLRRRPALRVLPFVVTALAYVSLFSLNPMVNPVQPWAMRRFVLAGMPGLALLTAYAIAALPLRRLHWRRGVQVLAVVALLCTFLRADRPILAQTEYAGFGQQIAQLAHQFESGALLLFDNGEPSLHIAQPLAYVYDLNVFVLQRSSPDPALVDPFIADWQQRGQPVYLVATGGALDWRSTQWTLQSPALRSGDASQPPGAVDLRFQQLKRSIDRPPTETESVSYLLDVYRVVPSPSVPRAQAQTQRVNMESGELPYVGGGFYGLEKAADGLSYRWTDGAARVRMPVPAAGGALVRLRVAGGRPVGVEAAHLSIVVNGTLLAEELLPEGFAFQTLEVSVPGAVLRTNQAEALVELRSNTWAPASAAGASAGGSSTDPRALGVVVDWIEWEPRETVPRAGRETVPRAGRETAPRAGRETAPRAGRETSP